MGYELEFGDGWLMQAKGWFTHQEIDARAANNLANAPGTGLVDPTVFPVTTTFGYEEFNNGGLDLRFRKRWGDDGMFRGSALTFGSVVYWGDAPFQRYTLQNTRIGMIDANFGPNFLYAPRGSKADTIRNGVDIGPTLDQDRTANYQAFFFEDLIRIGKFHIVPSFRLDHENVQVDSSAAPWLSPPLAANSPLIGPDSISADHWIPLWGVGLGNDFGHLNESYFTATTGWRPTRFFDIAGTTRTIPFGEEIPEPFHSLDFELGVHGTPIKGLWYDVGLFWTQFDNRTENMNVAGSNTQFIVVNTGSSRHRGFEGEISYDLLAPFQHDLAPAPEPDPKSSPKNVVVGPVSPPLQLIVFSNLQLLNAEFTESGLIIPQTGQTARRQHAELCAGCFVERRHHFPQGPGISTLPSLASTPPINSGPTRISPNPAMRQCVILVPAKIPSYKVFTLSGEVYLTHNVRLFAGISNLFNEKYYSRVFLNGLIDPAPSRSGYGGISVEF